MYDLKYLKVDILYTLKTLSIVIIEMIKNKIHSISQSPDFCMLFFLSPATAIIFFIFFRIKSKCSRLSPWSSFYSSLNIEKNRARPRPCHRHLVLFFFRSVVVFLLTGGPSFVDDHCSSAKQPKLECFPFSSAYC